MASRAALIHHLRQRLRQGGSTLFPEALQLKPEAKAHPAQLQPPEPAEPLQQRRSGCREQPQRLTQCPLHQRRGAGLGVAPQIHVDHHRSPPLQLQQQISAQKSGFASTPEPREEQPRSQTLVQDARPQQAARQLSGQLGAAEELGQGVREFLRQP